MEQYLNLIGPDFYRVTQLCWRGLGSRNSVHPSVRLSHACFVTNPKNLPVIFLYHMEGQSFYTVNHKKRDIVFLTITLANLNRFL